MSGPQGQASFVLSKQLYTTCGTYDVEFDIQDNGGGKRLVGTGTEVVDQKHVALGAKSSDGKGIAGSLWEVDTSGGSPSFVGDPADPAAELDSFALKTRDALQMSPSTLAVKFKELTVDDVPVVMIRTEKLSIV
ncbi:MAG: hypothetical protein LQ340_000830 [Diploschistes diacapsis]|nr:MAG: hypothetical protein LQ340_000830 [Diploschistes diacapsis]